MSNKVTLSVVLATLNEEHNIGACLNSVKHIADEIVVVDEGSSDRTREIAKSFGATVYEVRHEPIFHVTKQKAIDKAKGDWILQLDADERVTDELAKEIVEVINSSNEELLKRVLLLPATGYRIPDTDKLSLFRRHQRLIEQREGSLGKKTGQVVAFFIPRVNYFLGAPLIHAGVYPDGVIRLFKKGNARLPGKSVHELMEVDGEIGWLYNDLEHHESPTLKRYLDRMNRYTDLQANELKQNNTPRNYWYLFKYSILLPTSYFLQLYVRHKGFLDGIRGFLWSFFSASHYPIAYFKYYQSFRS